jgi:hypothetical protein
MEIGDKTSNNLALRDFIISSSHRNNHE